MKELPKRYLIQTVRVGNDGFSRTYIDVHDLFNFLVISRQINAATLVMKLLKKDKEFMNNYEEN